MNNIPKGYVRIYGAGGHSQVIKEVLSLAGYEVSGTFDDRSSGYHHKSVGVASGILENTNSFPHKGDPVIIAIGNNCERAHIASLLQSKFQSALHPTAIISPSATIGEGTVVFAGSIVQSNTTIGKHVIINTAASIDHDNTIGDCAHISPKAALCGHVEIGEGTHVGTGASIIPLVKVGKWCTIGAGSVVLKDVPDYCTVVGNPARIIKTTPPDFVTDAFRSSAHKEDIVFVGSGISSTFTLLRYLEELQQLDIASPVRITMIEKHDEFFTGLPYGNRSGVKALLITSLDEFLPEEEKELFRNWLSIHKEELLRTYRSEGGPLVESWFREHKTALNTNEWDELYLPRWFFGTYISEKIDKAIREAKQSGKARVNLLKAHVVSISQSVEKEYVVHYRNGRTTPAMVAKHVVLGIGSIPAQPTVLDSKLQSHIPSTGHGIFSSLYEQGLPNVLREIKTYIKSIGEHSHVLIIGANASAMEVLFLLNDDPEIAEQVRKFTILSGQGTLPDNAVSSENSTRKLFVPNAILTLGKKQRFTAQEIAEAVYKDVDNALEQSLTNAEILQPISNAFCALLGRLSTKEKYEFAGYFGHQIGRKQRRAGPHYYAIGKLLLQDKRLESIAGRFQSVTSVDGYAKTFKYSDSLSGTETIGTEPVHCIINCTGSMSLTSEMAPSLLKQLLKDQLISPTRYANGIAVDNTLQASENLYVMGPLLAGNVVNDMPIWHVEHCGRIAMFSGVLAQYLLEKTMDSPTYAIATK